MTAQGALARKNGKKDGGEKEKEKEKEKEREEEPSVTRTSLREMRDLDRGYEADEDRPKRPAKGRRRTRPTARQPEEYEANEGDTPSDAELLSQFRPLRKPAHDIRFIEAIERANELLEAGFYDVLPHLLESASPAIGTMGEIGSPGMGAAVKISMIAAAAPENVWAAWAANAKRRNVKELRARLQSLQPSLSLHPTYGDWIRTRLAAANASRGVPREDLGFRPDQMYRGRGATDSDQMREFGLGSDPSTGSWREEDSAVAAAYSTASPLTEQDRLAGLDAAGRRIQDALGNRTLSHLANTIPIPYVSETRQFVSGLRPRAGQRRREDLKLAVRAAIALADAEHEAPDSEASKEARALIRALFTYESTFNRVMALAAVPSMADKAVETIVMKLEARAEERQRWADRYARKTRYHS